MAPRRSARHRVRVVAPLAVLGLALAPGLPTAAHVGVTGAQNDALSVDLGGAERNPSDGSNDRVDLGGSNQTDRNSPSDNQPDPPADPQPDPPQQPRAPQPEAEAPEPVFTAQPDKPAGNGGSADAVPAVDGDGWLPTEAPVHDTAVDATQGPKGSAVTGSTAADNPIGEAAGADDPTASGSSAEATETSHILRWGSALAAAVVAGLAVLGYTLMRARRSAA